MPLSTEQAIAIRCRLETALHATNEALHCALADDGSELDRTIALRLRDALTAMRISKERCDRVLGHTIAALIDG